MTQQLTDLGQGSAVAQHRGGQPVAKRMCSFRGCIDAGAFDRMLDDRSNGF